MRRRSDAIARETHTPETDDGLGKFQLDVAADVAVVLGFDNLTDDFLLGFFVGEKKQLARSDGRGQANDSAAAENQDGFCGFGERLALGAAFDGASTVHGNGDFERNGLLLNGVV